MDSDIHFVVEVHIPGRVVFKRTFKEMPESGDLLDGLRVRSVTPAGEGREDIDFVIHLNCTA